MYIIQPIIFYQSVILDTSQLSWGDGGSKTFRTQGDNQQWHYNTSQFEWFSTILQYTGLFIPQVSSREAKNAVFWLSLEWKSANWADVSNCPSGPAILEAAGELLIGGQHHVALVTMITWPPEKQLGRRAGKHPPHWLQLRSLILISKNVLLFWIGHFTQ